MKFGILTQYYPPEVGAPQRRLSELAERMVSAGHEVHVLTAMPNYPQGRIHDGYRGLLRREVINGVKVTRTAIYPTQRPTFVHRLTNYFSFVITSLILGTLYLPTVDFLLVESPPLFLGISGIWLARVKGARLIFNVSDLWPESAVSLGIVRAASRTHRLSQWLERTCYRLAWLITGQSKGILSDIQHRFPSRRTYRLSNGVDVSQFGEDFADAEVRQQLRGSATTIAVYAGLHGLAQGLDQVVEAAGLLRDSPDLKFVLVGDGPEKCTLIKQAASRGLTNIEFHDPVPAAQVPRILASADIIIITLKSDIPGAVPSKLYEAMASTKPVVLVAGGEPAEIVESNDAGLVVEPGDYRGLADALRTLSDDPTLRSRLGSCGRLAAERDFSREQIVNSFIQYLKGAIP